jgi:hypothetical protein
VLYHFAEQNLLHRRTVPKVMPALLEKMEPTSEEVDKFLRMAALSLFAELPQPAHDLQRVSQPRRAGRWQVRGLALCRHDARILGATTCAGLGAHDLENARDQTIVTASSGCVATPHSK